MLLDNPRSLRLLVSCLIVAVLQASAAGAGEVLVFLDNSASIKQLTRTYRDDILSVLGASPDRVFFAPIGDNASQGVLVDSYAPPAERTSLVDKTFRFSDVFTKIDGSLRAVEQSTSFVNIDRILVVSDMEPDSDNVGPWSFNNQDLVDLEGFLGRLGRWASAEQKKVTLVLHGWQAVPVVSPADIEDFPKEIRWRINQVPMSGNNLVDRDLVVRGLLRLKRDYPGIEMRVIPLTIDGDPNEEELRDVLCNYLAIKDPEVCWTYEAERTDFKMRVDFDRRMLLSTHLQETLRQSGGVKISIGPPRTIQMAKVESNLAQDHDPGVDFHFRVRAGTGGKPFYNPTLTVSLKKADGSVEELGNALTPPQSLTSEEEMVAWANGEIGNSLRSLITDHYPPVTKLKRFEVTGPDGQPLASGYRLQVRLSYSSTGSEPFESRTQETRRDAPVSFLLPTFYDEGVVRLKTRLLQDGVLKEGPEVDLHRLSKNDVKKRASVSFQVDPTVTRAFEVTHSGDPTVRFRFQVFLSTPDEKDPPVYVSEVAYGSPRAFRLLPGSYKWEAIPLNQPTLLAVTGGEEVHYPPEETRSIELGIRPDPLADESQWDVTVPNLMVAKSLTGDSIDVVNRSARTLPALFRYSSSYLELGQKDNLIQLWQAIADVLFDPNALGTMQRRLERSLIEAGLTGADGALRPEAYIFARAAFSVFLKGEDPFVSGDSETALENRREYNAWLDRITDNDPGDNLISPALKKHLRVER